MVSNTLGLVDPGQFCCCMQCHLPVQPSSSHTQKFHRRWRRLGRCRWCPAGGCRRGRGCFDGCYLDRKQRKQNFKYDAAMFFFSSLSAKCFKHHAAHSPWNFSPAPCCEFNVSLSDGALKITIHVFIYSSRAVSLCLFLFADCVLGHVCCCQISRGKRY